MRNGVLIAEDSPANLLAKYHAETLDEVFLSLCQSQDNKSVNRELSKNEPDDLEAHCTSEPTEEKKSTKLSKVKALVRKNFLQLLRRPA